MRTYLNKWIFLFAIAVVPWLGSCEKNNDNEVSKASSNPQPNKLDPGTASSGEALILTGSGIGGITSILFEKDSVPALFNSNFNTESALVFAVPVEAESGQQNIIFKNSQGVEFKVPFNVLGLPTVSAVSNYNFVTGTQITITGRHLAGVTKVVLTGTTTNVEIISTAKTSLVIKMPVVPTTQTKLDITNETGTTTTTQEFVDLDKAYKIFTEGYDNGFENGSWGPAEVSETAAATGTKSFKATYNKGNWSADGFAKWTDGVPYSADYKFLSFWLKGASAEYTLYITGDQKKGGSYGNSDQTTPIIVKPNIWNYYKLKLSDVQLWKGTDAFKQLGFWIKGPDAQDESFYFDDVILIK